MVQMGQVMVPISWCFVRRVWECYQGSPLASMPDWATQQGATNVVCRMFMVLPPSGNRATTLKIYKLKLG